MTAETFLLRINYHSYDFIHTDCLNVAFDCILMFDSQIFLFSSSFTTIRICGESPRLTKRSATNCQLSSKVRVGNLVNLGLGTTLTIPRSVKRSRRWHIFIMMPSGHHYPSSDTKNFLLKDSHILHKFYKERPHQIKSCKAFVEGTQKVNFHRL